MPWPAAGGTDITARKLAEGLEPVLGQSIIIDNRGGANGILGTTMVAKAPPDGYTLMVSTLTSHATNPTLYKSLPYDSIRDFAPVTVLQSVPMVIVVPTASPIRTVSDIVQMAKAKPGAISYASFGAGSMSHLAGELMKMMGGFDAIHVPYKGGGPALIDTIAGHVQYYFSGVNSALPHISGGRLRAIAVTSSGRSRPLPNVPTVAETPEFKGYEAVVPTGVWLPANTPAVIVQALHAACLKVVRSPEYQKALDAEGSEPIGNTPEQMLAEIRRDTDLLAKVIRQANVKVD